nr:hypothetical protein [Acidobacteriota bacterium]
MPLWLLPLAGTLIAAAYPLASHFQMVARENNASESLAAIHRAQQTFRGGAGRGGYATAIESLTAVCPGEAISALSQGRQVDGYTIQLRAARDARLVGSDCHGR